MMWSSILIPVGPLVGAFESRFTMDSEDTLKVAAKKALRKALLETRLNLPDPLPALHRWKEDGELLDQPQPRRIGLPVVNKAHKTMTFHAWYPGCPMEEDAYGIPKPKDTELIVPTLLFAPCVGYGPGGYRLGYGGGFYDRMLSTLDPKPFTVGLGFGVGFVEDFEPEAHDQPLDAILSDYGVVWPV